MPLQFSLFEKYAAFITGKFVDSIKSQRPYANTSAQTHIEQPVAEEARGIKIYLVSRLKK